MRTDGKTGIIQRLFMSLFGLIFMAAGGFFAYMILTDVWDNYQTRSWTKTPCVIMESQVDVVRDGYRFRVGYQYSFNGREWTSHKLNLKDDNVFSKVGEADAKVRQYAPGGETYCYVNPKMPGQSILEFSSLAMGFAVFLPMIFIVIGAAVFIGGWTSSSKPERQVRSKADGGSSWKGRLGGAAFFSIFFLAGSLIGYYFFLSPWINSLTSGDWKRTECTILSSRVQTHDGDDGDTYSVDILYAYEVNGRAYRSSQYSFMTGSSSGYSGKKEIVRRYPAGSQAVCYVNPDDPSEAVLNKSLGGMAWFAILPLIFMIVGGVGILYSLFGAKDKRPSYTRSRKRPQTAGFSESFKGENADVTGGGMTILKPKYSPWFKVFGSLFAAVFWNGIVGIAVFQCVKGWMTGNGSIGFTIFISIFVLIGIAIIFGFFHAVLAAFNPKLTITLFSDFICIGDEVSFNWEFKGSANRISRFTLTLTGTEAASYRRGTDTITATHNFYQMVVTEQTNAAFMQRGQGRIAIPGESMHTFKSSNNEIMWVLKAHCDISKWPDTKDDYTISIHPLQEGRF